eukprot:TRINITY_DN1688_c0_g1_i1.p1 TRINITY_DN1688_c0_g1~~TRINITY_DN1688_c0_g1_i1.p1  ORF type:complete len:210 (-),score=48.66 TRINITY_DN1688_c0_g1_i1:34-642(-)
MLKQVLLLTCLLLSVISAAPVKSQLENKPYCVICEFVIRELENYIVDNATEAQIISAVENVCDVLPGSIAPTCHQLIREEGQSIIELLIATETPEVICTKLTLCDPTKEYLIRAALEMQKRISSGPLCQVCELAVQLVENELARNSTIVVIEHEIENTLCNFISYLKKPCDSFVEEYTPIIINYIIKNQSPEHLCKDELGLC